MAIRKKSTNTLSKGEFYLRIHENHHDRFAFCHIFDRDGEHVMAPDGIAVAIAACPKDMIYDLRQRVCKGAEFIGILGPTGRPSSFHYFVTKIVSFINSGED